MGQTLSVALVGAGAMGGALLKGWIQQNSIDAARSIVFEPQTDAPALAIAAEAGLRVNPPRDGLAVDALVIAVKPQTASDVLPAFTLLARDALVVSVMAGRNIASIGTLLGATRIVRAMPNLPASIGCGVSGLCAPGALASKDRSAAAQLMAAVGEVVWVESERLLDAVTAISGSGPAYFFLMAEALAEAGRALGIDAAAAAGLARATLVGAGAVAGVDARDVAALRRAVASPGGTTEAALSVLDGDNAALRTLMKEAAAAAFRRAGELTS
jgi:pyrroline-5-carboxylate reductase